MAVRDRAAAPKAITSLQNERVKAIRALEMRKVRKETGLFVAEGASLLVTAREHGFVPETLVYRTGSATDGIARGLVDWALKSGAEVLEVSEAVLGKLASKDNPQNLLAVFRQRWAKLPDAKTVARADVWVALEEVRDPGNLGTIIRTVDAVGAKGVILIGAICDPYSREGVRATMGSVFAVPLVKTTREAFLDWRKGWTGDVVGTHLKAREDFRKATYEAPTLLVMGSEGPGLSEVVAEACTRTVKIPMAGALDSLNLAVATALMLYQIRGPHLTLSTHAH
ncbi:MAG TPA: RNA methyltransferase [Hyphomicrobium sp.]|jgi:TrmH family RNA methyltransferase